MQAARKPCNGNHSVKNKVKIEVNNGSQPLTNATEQWTVIKMISISDLVAHLECWHRKLEVPGLNPCWGYTFFSPKTDTFVA